MVTMILSENFPSEEYCNMYTDNKDDNNPDSIESEEIVIPTCPNICCKYNFFIYILFSSG